MPARVLTFVYQGSLGTVDSDAAESLVAHVQSLLAAGEADAAEFHHLPQDSPILDVLRAHEARWWCRVEPTPNAHWEMAVLSEADFFAKKVKSKHRSGIRRKQRELEAEFQGRLAWRWLDRFDDVPGLCRRLEAVAARTYQRELGGGFVDDDEHRRRFQLFADRNQLRVQVLEIDGAVRAFWLGSIYQGVFHSAETGYDPELRSFEVGTQMFIRMLDELAREGVQTLDFGLGDAFYKQRYADRRWDETTVRLFARTVKGAALCSAIVSFGFVDRGARWLVRRLGALDQVKTGWRRRLVRSKADGKPGAAAEATSPAIHQTDHTGSEM
jgi:hypothetical protein